MAYYKQTYQVGDYVYEPFKPQKPGKIISIIGTGRSQLNTIKFIDGTMKQLEPCRIADFNWLIADHQQKLQTHTNKLKVLATL